MKPHRGTLILVLSIMSFFVLGPFLSIPAWIMGNNDLREIDAGTMDPAGRDHTRTGRIIAKINALIFAGLLVMGGLVAIAISLN